MFHDDDDDDDDDWIKHRFSGLFGFNLQQSTILWWYFMVCKRPKVSGYSVMGRKRTPFPHLQFIAQNVLPPQIVIMLGKGTRPLSGVQT